MSVGAKTVYVILDPRKSGAGDGAVQLGLRPLVWGWRLRRPLVQEGGQRV